MNRREFLCVAAMFSAGLAIESVCAPTHFAEAAWHTGRREGGGLFIKETNLKFSSLENRERTDAIVIHHVGNTNRDVSASDIHRWHLENGWVGIGYHYVIRKNGVIERGRPVDTVGAHCYGANSYTVGINVVGNFEDHVPSRQQVVSVMRLVTELCRMYALEPSDNTILGHRDVTSTACPGENLYAILPKVVRGVREFYA